VHVRAAEQGCTEIDIAVMMGWGTAEGYAANYSVD
jgi:hypothetical protein